MSNRSVEAHPGRPVSRKSATVYACRMTSRNGAFVIVTRPGGNWNLTRDSPDVFTLTEATLKDGACANDADESAMRSTTTALRRMRITAFSLRSLGELGH